MAPLMEFLEPALKPILALKDSLMKNLMKIPGLEKLLKKIGLQSLDGAASIAKKMGAKALPWVGGLINVLFAYDRFASGDLVVGYGIDYAQRNRNLSFIGKVRFV